MRIQVSSAVLLLMSLSVGACSDDNDDAFKSTAVSPAGGDQIGSTMLDAAVPPIQVAPLDAAALSDGGDGGSVAERLHDTRTFTVDPATLPFDALTNFDTHRWSGVLEGAGYRVEVPKAGWNGILVMYAHGYRGPGAALTVGNPPIRRHLLEKGYAWAASSYAKNFYDVRAGVEDTNKLALAFNRIAMENGQTLPEPSKRYIIGHSMGGHVTGAAVEREAQATAKNKVKYQAGLPMCGVLGDTQLFNYFAGYQLAAHELANVPVPNPPMPASYAPVRAQLQAALWTTFPAAVPASASAPAMVVPGVTNALGDKLKKIVMNLTGGDRPGFEQGFASGSLQGAVWTTFGGDGKIDGILSRAITDTRSIVYQLDTDPAQSEEERLFNANVDRSLPEADPNPQRSDGVRWIPAVNGEFDVPVITLHTLGDLYVPFSMEQIYRRRAQEKGSDPRLVQRAIRGVGHCEFTYAEQTEAFEALANWEQNGVKPEGDELLDPATVANPSYGCRFTRAATADDSATLPASRATIAPCPAP